MAMTLDQLVDSYVKLRDMLKKEKEAYEAKIAPMHEAMAKVEGVFLQHMLDNKMDSFSTVNGTPYRSRQVSVSVADWEVFRQWAEANGHDAMFTHGANKKVVDEFVQQTKETPPGLNYSAAWVVNVRRK